jgi:hypothetical protein
MKANEALLEERLIFAVCANDLQTVQSLLAEGANQNIKIKGEIRGLYTPVTPLGWAAHIGNSEMALLLIKHPKTDIELYAPLVRASQQRRVDIVQLLLENGANPNIKDVVGDTPTRAAIRPAFGETAPTPTQKEILLLLIQHGAEMNRESVMYATDLLGDAMPKIVSMPVVPGEPQRSRMEDPSHPGYPNPTFHELRSVQKAAAYTVLAGQRRRGEPPLGLLPKELITTIAKEVLKPENTKDYWQAVLLAQASEKKGLASSRTH